MRSKCSFCGKDQHSVKTLFRGLPNKETMTSVYICDDCISQCSDRLKQEQLIKAEEAALEDRSGERNPHGAVNSAL